MMDASTKEPLHSRVAGWLERAFNPIMVKELRASLRGSRFFVAHLTVLALFATGLLIAFGVLMADAGVRRYYGGMAPGFVQDASSIGLRVYLVTQLIQLGVVFLVVPGLAAASVTVEREAQTHELLLSSTLRARQIVWGKFTAAMTQTFLLLVSMVPMVALCFLFGGVTVGQILSNYVFLFLLAALVVMASLSISASSQSTQRAVGSVYAMALAASGIVGWLVALAVNDRDFEVLLPLGVHYGFLPSEALDALRHRFDAFDRIMFVHALPGFLWAALFSLFFINASNRLKPIHANRSTPLRVHYLATLAGAAALILTVLYVKAPPSEGSHVTRAETVVGLVTAFSMLLFFGTLFACEDAVLAPGLARKAARSRGPFRLLQPGAGSGAVFSVTCAAALLGTLFLALLPYAQDFGKGAWLGAPGWVPLSAPLFCALAWTLFCALLGRFLSVHLPERPVLVRGLLGIIAGVLSAFPFIHYAISRSIESRSFTALNLHGPVTLGLSPVAAVISALDLTTPRSFPLYAAGIPIPALFCAFALGGALVLELLSRRILARRRFREAAP